MKSVVGNIKCSACGKSSSADGWGCDWYDKEDTAVCPECGQGYWPATQVRGWIEGDNNGE